MTDDAKKSFAAYPTDAEVGALMPFLRTAEHASPESRTKLCHEAFMCITALRARLSAMGDQFEKDMAFIAESILEIGNLRAKLAEAQADKEKLGRELNLARYGQPDFSWQVHKEALAEANARADRAKAALAAQIEADARIAEDAWLDGVPVAEISAAILAHSHDRSALDRLMAEHEVRLREAREISEAEKIAIRNKALREAASIKVVSHDGLVQHEVHPMLQAAILNMIDKDKEN